MWGPIVRVATSIGWAFHKLVHPIWVKAAARAGVALEGGTSTFSGLLAGMGVGAWFGMDDDEVQGSHVLTAIYTLSFGLLALLLWIGWKQLKKVTR